MEQKEAWIVLGDYVDAWGKVIPVGLPMRDLKVHLSALGTTGSGKSTFLRNLALQAFDLGATVVVIEPHGDLILDREEGILAALPAEKLAQVTVVDLNSPWPPQMNLAAVGLAAGRSVAVETAMRCIRVVEDASWSGAVRMREILEHSLHLLLAVLGEQASMVALQKFLTDGSYRQKILKKAGPDVGESREYWARMQEVWAEAKDGGDSVLEVPLRRVGGFLREERFRRSLSLPALAPELELQMASLMNATEPRMILVPLQASELGDDAKRVFGTLFMQMIANTFMARAKQAKEERRQALVIIDEFADLAGGEVGALVKMLLAQARKFGASVVLGTQAIHQLPSDVKDEVKSNTNIKIVLRVADEDDAKTALRNLGTASLSVNDLLNIEKFHGYARVMVGGSPQPPYYFRALPPLQMKQQGGKVHLPPGPLSHPKLADLRELHRLAAADPREAKAAIESLTKLSDKDFALVVEAQVKSSLYAAQQLLSQPELEPDPVKRALKMSRAKHGLPWWFYEAQYRRLRFK